MAIDLLGPANAPGSVTVRPGDARAFGVADTFFNDCSSPTVDDGTEFQAAWFNAILANARALIRSNGQTAGAVDIVTQDNADDNLLLKAILHLIQRGQQTYADDTGTADAMVVALSPAPAELKKGMRIFVKKIATANATTSPTLLVNGLGPTAIRIAGYVPQVGQLQASAGLFFEYDGTFWQAIGGAQPRALYLKSQSGGTQSFPLTSPGVFTTMTDWAAIGSFLGDNTFSGGALTIGPNGGGVYDIFVQALITNATLAIQITVNGAVVAYQSYKDVLVAGIQLSTKVLLAPGDVVRTQLFTTVVGVMTSSNDTAFNFNRVST